MRIRRPAALTTSTAALATLLVALGCGSSEDLPPPGGQGASTGVGASSSGAGGEGTGAGGSSSSGTGGSSSSGQGGSPGLPDPFECAAPESEWVFCSDFEEGNKDVWDDYDGNPDDTNLLMQDDGPFVLSDNHVMRIRVPAGRGGADIIKVLPSSHDRLYARWYAKWEAGFDFNAPNHGSGLHAGDRNLLGRSDYRPQGNDWFSSWVEHTTSEHSVYAYTYYRGMYQDCVDPNGQCWGDHFPCTVDEGQTFCEKPQHRETAPVPTLMQDQWRCIEMMMDGGTATNNGTGADGQLDVWVDGVELGPWTDLWLRTDPNLKLEILWLGIFHHGEHSVEGMMLDNVVVSTERIGCP